MLRSSLLTMLFAMSIIGCSKSSLEGDAFITYGAGDVKAVAGARVALVPNVTEDKIFLTAFKKLEDIVLEGANDNIVAACDALKIRLEDSLTSPAKKPIVNEPSGAKQPVPCSSEKSIFEENKMAATAIENSFAAQREELKIELAKLEGEKAPIEAAYRKELGAKANALYEAQTEKLTGWLKREALDSGPCFIKNRSKYIVTNIGKAGYKYKGRRIPYLTINMYSYDSSTDSYGFTIPAHVKQGKAKKLYEYCSLTPPDSPSRRKSLLDDGFKFGKTALADFFYVIQDGLYFEDVTFAHSIKRTEEGSNVSYTAENVNFEKLASEKYTIAGKSELDAINLKIATVIERSNSLDEKHKNVPEVSAYLEASEKYNSCEDNVTLHKALGAIKYCNSESSSRKNFDAIKKSATIASETGENFTTVVDALMEKNLEHLKKSKISEDFQSLYKYALDELNARYADTTIQGHYSFQDIPSGDYLVLSHFDTNFSSGLWAEKVNVSGPTRIDLNLNNLLPVSFDWYLSHVITGTIECFKQVCSDKDILERIHSNIDDEKQLLALFEEKKEEMEELKDNLEKLKRLLDQ